VDTCVTGARRAWVRIAIAVEIDEKGEEERRGRSTNEVRASHVEASV
jgi:hypothetical protein